MLPPFESKKRHLDRIWPEAQFLFPDGSLLFAGCAWLIAAVWLWRVLPALRMLPSVPNLLDAKYDTDGATDWPSINVVVPAKDEAAAIERCLRSLLASEYPNLQIIAVDDRSTDGTGNLMDWIADAPESKNR